MKTILLVTSTLTTQIALTANAQTTKMTENLVSKPDTDYIFNLRLEEWESYVKNMVFPSEWKVRFSKQITGTDVMAYNTKTGNGLLIQPFYDSKHSPLTFLVIGSYFKAGTLPSDKENFREQMQKEVSRELGENYSVSTLHANMPPFEGIEFHISNHNNK